MTLFFILLFLDFSIYYCYTTNNFSTRGGEGRRRTDGRVGGRPAGAQERGEQTGSYGPGDGRKEEGRVGEQVKY